VEILAALRQRLPAFPEVSPKQLAELRTLRQIAQVLDAAPANQETAQRTPAENSNQGTMLQQAASTISSAKMTSPADLANVVRDVIADKTGYPADMLDDDMALEAELGVDSIKKVEIFAELRSRLPDVADIEPAQLGELVTLRQIAHALAQSASAPRTSPESAPLVEAGQPDASPVSQEGPDEAARRHGIFRQVLELKEMRPPGLPMPGLSKASRVAVTAEHRPLAEAIAGELRRRGYDAALGLEARADVVISTSGLADHLDGEAAHLAAFAAARQQARQSSKRAVTLVTLQDSGGSFGRGQTKMAQALRSGMTGLVKTARFEWPNASVKAIDIQRDSMDINAQAQRIVDELQHGGAEVEVGLPLDGRRLVPTTRIAPLSAIERANASGLRDGLVFLVSGGGRGITAESVIGLAAVRPMRFALLGRTRLADWPTDIDPNLSVIELQGMLARKAMVEGRKVIPAEIGRHADRLCASRDIEATLRRLKAAGSDAIYRSVDVSNAEELKDVVQDVRRNWGPISGLIHGAGVLADKLIVDKTDAQVLQVYRTKVGGLVALLEALRDEPLEFISLFASIAGRFGNPGQADYAMANEVLNRVAWVLQATRSRCHVSCTNWGPWDGGMVTDPIRRQFVSRGIPIIPISIGVDAFVRELAAGCETPEIVFGGQFDPARMLETKTLSRAPTSDADPVVLRAG